MTGSLVLALLLKIGAGTLTPPRLIVMIETAEAWLVICRVQLAIVASALGDLVTSALGDLVDRPRPA